LATLGRGLQRLVVGSGNDTQNDRQSGPEVARKWPENWPENKVRVIDAIKVAPTITIVQLEQQLGIGHTTIKKYLSELQEEGVLKRLGAARGGRWEVKRG